MPGGGGAMPPGGGRGAGVLPLPPQRRPTTVDSSAPKRIISEISFLGLIYKLSFTKGPNCKKSGISFSNELNFSRQTSRARR